MVVLPKICLSFLPWILLELIQCWPNTCWTTKKIIIVDSNFPNKNNKQLTKRPPPFSQKKKNVTCNQPASTPHDKTWCVWPPQSPRSNAREPQRRDLQHRPGEQSSGRIWIPKSWRFGWFRWFSLLGQWLNFKLFGITYLVGKRKFKLFFQGPLAKWFSGFTIVGEF